MVCLKNLPRSKFSYSFCHQQAFSEIQFQIGKINCPFLLPGGSIGRGYVLEFLNNENHNIVINSSEVKAIEKISANLEFKEFWKKIDVCLTNFEINQILINKLCHQFLMTTKLFIWPNIPSL